MKTAIVFGASGLVGSSLLNFLLKEDNFSKIKIFVRKPIDFSNSKIETIITDFNNLDIYLNDIFGDFCFFCLGTTKKDTPDKNEYRKIEYDIPVKISQIAKKNNISSFMYVSSLGSTPKTKNTYLKNKGEAEDVMKNLTFSKLSIIRPSLMLGSRKKFRLAEYIGQKIFKNLNFLFLGPLRKYRAIKATNVAKAMIVISRDSHNDDNIYYDSEYLEELADKY